jgi:hypothetical protein
MEGNYTHIGKVPVMITRAELWASCKTEDEYFRVLKQRQVKPKPMTEPIFRIPDAEPGIIPE